MVYKDDFSDLEMNVNWIDSIFLSIVNIDKDVVAISNDKSLITSAKIIIFLMLVTALVSGFGMSKMAYYSFGVNKIDQIAVIIGWALTIFALDAALMRGNKGKNALGIRIVVGSIIGAISSTAILFAALDSSINEVMNDKRNSQIRKFENFNKTKIDVLNKNILDIKENAKFKEKDVEELRKAYIAETDGTGGSGIRDLGPISKIKLDEYKKAEDQLKNDKKEKATEIASIKDEIKALEEHQKELVKTAVKSIGTDPLSRYAYLKEYMSKIPYGNLVGAFLFLVFTVIENLPIIAKLNMNKECYEPLLEEVNKNKIELSKAKIKNISEIQKFMVDKEVELRKTGTSIKYSQLKMEQKSEGVKNMLNEFIGIFTDLEKIQEKFAHLKGKIIDNSKVIDFFTEKVNEMIDLFKKL